MSVGAMPSAGASEANGKVPYIPGLNVRLDHWAMRRGGRLKIGIERAYDFSLVTARIGPFVGKGATASEALNQLADQLVHEGWEDDRQALGRVAR